MVIRPNTLFILALFGTITCSCRTPSVQNMENQPYAAILDRTATYAQLVSAITQLSSKTESAGFWSSIANDPTYPDYHRRLCISYLFRRHISAGMTLSQVAKVLDHPLWLSVNNINEIKNLAGLIPVKLTDEDSVFSIVVLPGTNQNTSAVFLRVQGKLTKEQLFETLKYGDGHGETENRVLQEVALNENNS